MRINHFKHYILVLSHRYLSLVVVQALLAIANSVANSFSLIFLLRANFSYIDCALFIFILAATAVLLIALASRTLVQYFEFSIIMALALLSAYYISFMILSGYILLFTAAVFFGAYITLFWVPYNSLVMHITPKSKRGAVVGIYFLIFPIIGVIGPSIGGAIIELFGYNALFLFAFFVLIIDMLFVHFAKVVLHIKLRIITPELLRSLKLKLKGFFHIDLNLKAMSNRLKIALFAEGVHDGIFWVYIPLVGFEFAKSEFSLGHLFSLFAFAGGLMTVALGYLADKIHDRARIIKLGALMAAVMCIMMAIIPGYEQFIMLMSLAFLWLAMIPSFLFAMTADALEKEKKKGVVIREFMLNSGRTLGALACIIILLLFNELRVAMLIAGLAIALICTVR